MDDFLATMGELSRRRCEAARRVTPLEALREACELVPPSQEIRLVGFDVIAEVKRVSPAEGRLDGDEVDAMLVLRGVEDRAVAYAKGGAAMISVLTEPTRFGGDLSHLAAVGRVAGVPVMRKDFLVDSYQVVEARAHGASAVLLIVRLLDDAGLEAMLRETLALGMHALVEAFDAAELERAGRAIERVGGTMNPGERVLVGLNCRDLATLVIEPSRFAALAPHFPPGVVRVAESGVRTPEDAERLAELGYGLALVGTALMRNNDPVALVRAMLARGRMAVRHGVDGGRDG